MKLRPQRERERERGCNNWRNVKRGARYCTRYSLLVTGYWLLVLHTRIKAGMRPAALSWSQVCLAPVHAFQLDAACALRSRQNVQQN